jgi:DNA-binding CsgD family transcriptional regulator
MAVMNTHYCRAMTLQKRLDKLEEALIQSSNILDLIEFGLVLYGADRTLHFVNAAAQRILDAGDGLRLTKNDLAIGDRSAEERFQSLIDAIYRPNLLLSQRSGGIIAIPRLSRGRPYSLMVVPMQARNAAKESVTAAVFLFDPSTRKTTAIQLFVSSYGLSRSEAELAHFLALGGTLEEAAVRRSVSRNTVKTQLHSIFAKTDTNRQSELVALLLRSVAGINLQTS